MAATVSRPPSHVVVRTWHLFDAKDQVRRCEAATLTSTATAQLLRADLRVSPACCCLLLLLLLLLQTVGRLAQRIAHLLQGKHHPDWTPQIDNGDSVTVVNAHLVQFTGRRWDKKLYRYHTGFPGGLKEIPARVMLQKHPTLILRKAVSGMLHHNKFKHERMERLKVFATDTHPHTAQLPYRWQEERQRMEQELTAEQLRQMGGTGATLPMLTDEMWERAMPTDPIIRQRWEEQQKREALERKEVEEFEASERQGFLGAAPKAAAIPASAGGSKPAAAPSKPAAPAAPAKKK